MIQIIRAFRRVAVHGFLMIPFLPEREQRAFPGMVLPATLERLSQVSFHSVQQRDEARLRARERIWLKLGSTLEARATDSETDVSVVCQAPLPTEPVQPFGKTQIEAQNLKDERQIPPQAEKGPTTQDSSEPDMTVVCQAPVHIETVQLFGAAPVEVEKHETPSQEPYCPPLFPEEPVRSPASAREQLSEHQEQQSSDEHSNKGLSDLADGLNALSSSWLHCDGEERALFPGSSDDLRVLLELQLKDMQGCLDVLQEPRSFANEAPDESERCDGSEPGSPRTLESTVPPGDTEMADEVLQLEADLSTIPPLSEFDFDEEQGEQREEPPQILASLPAPVMSIEDSVAQTRPYEEAELSQPGDTVLDDVQPHDTTPPEQDHNSQAEMQSILTLNAGLTIEDSVAQTRPYQEPDTALDRVQQAPLEQAAGESEPDEAAAGSSNIDARSGDVEDSARSSNVVEDSARSSNVVEDNARSSNTVEDSARSIQDSNVADSVVPDERAEVDGAPDIGSSHHETAARSPPKRDRPSPPNPGRRYHVASSADGDITTTMEPIIHRVEGMVKGVVGEMGGIQTVMDIMKTSQNSDVLNTCLGLLANLINKCSENKAVVAAIDGERFLSRVLLRATDPSLQLQCMHVINNMCVNAPKGSKQKLRSRELAKKLKQLSKSPDADLAQSAKTTLVNLLPS